MANPYTDPRYELARMAAAQRMGGVSFGRGVGPARLPDQIVKSQQSEGGTNPALMGLKALLKGVDTIAMPGRAVVSGIREIVDVFDKSKEADASFGDFFKQIKDPTFGVGKAFKVNTGHIWLDRLIGFAGDVALDPLTYMTFGAGHFAGYSGRLALAGKVLETTGDKALAAKAARWGRAALEVGDLERLGLNRSGVYLLGKRVKGYRIPFSESIGAGAEKSLARLRIWTSETAIGQRLQGKFMKKSLHEARLRLARGMASPDEAAGIIKLLNWEEVARGIKGQTAQEVLMKLKNVLVEEGASFESYRSTLYRVIEENAVRATASADEVRAADKWATFMKSLYDEVDTLAKEIDPQLDFGFIREGYFPRVVGDAGRKYMGDTSKPYANDLAKKFAKDGAIDEGGAFKTRLLKEGEEFFGYTLKAEDLTTERLNQIAREYGKIEGDFFETDIQKVMESYIEDHAQQMALLSRYKYLKDAKIIDFGDTLRWEETFVDSVAVGDAKVAIEEATNAANKAFNDGASAVKTLIDVLKTAEKEAEQRVARTSQMLDDVLTSAVDAESKAARAAEAAAQLDVVKNQLARIEESLMSLFMAQDNQWFRLSNLANLNLTVEDFNRVPGALDNIIKALGADSIDDPIVRSFFEAFGAKTNALDFLQSSVGAANVPAVVDNFFERIRGLIKTIDDLNIAEAVNEHYAVAAEEALSQGLSARQLSLDSALGKVQQEIKDLESEFQALMDGNTIMNANLEKAIEGKMVFADDSVIGQNINKIRRLVGATGVDESIRAKELFPFTYSEATMVKWISSELNTNPTGEVATIWNRISGGFAKLVQKDVSMSFEELSTRINGLFGFGVSLTDAREVAAHMVLRDLKLYESVERMPTHIRENFEELVTLLENAKTREEAIARWAGDAASEGDFVNFATRWRQTYETSLNEIEQHASLVKKLDEVQVLIDGAESGDAGLARLVGSREGVEMVLRSGGHRLDAALDSVFIDAADEIAQVNTVWGLRDLLERKIQVRENLLDEATITNPDMVDQLIGKTETIKKIEEEIARLTDQIERSNPVTEMLFGRSSGFKISDKNIAEAQSRLRELEITLTFEQDKLAQLEAKRYISPRDVVAKYAEKENDFVSSGSKSRARKSRKLGRNEYLGDATRDKLVESTVKYAMVSEIQTTMHRVAQVMLPYGQIPTEKLYRTVVARVGQKYLESSTRELGDIEHVITLVEGIRVKFNQQIRDLGKLGPEDASRVFKDLVRKELDGPNGAALRNVLGHKFASLEDPYELLDGWSGRGRGVNGKYGRELARQRGVSHAVIKAEYDEKFLKPWWKSVNPGAEFNREEALKALAAEVSMRQMRQQTKVVQGGVLLGEDERWLGSANFHGGFTISKGVTSKEGIIYKLGPFAREARLQNIEDFFDEILGYSSRVRSQVNRYGTVEEGTTHRIIGALEKARTASRRKVDSIHSLIDPLSNVDTWIANPFKRVGNPSSEGYASMLRSLADDLDLQIRWLTEQGRPQARLAANEAAQAEIELEKIAQEASQFPPAGSTRGKPIDRELVPKTDARAADYIRQRDNAIIVYNKLVSSPEYLKAQGDKQIVDVIAELAGLDLHQVDGFKVIKTEEAERFARAQTDLQRAASELEPRKAELQRRYAEAKKEYVQLEKTPADQLTVDTAQRQLGLQQEMDNISTEIADINKELSNLSVGAEPGSLSGYAVITVKNADGTSSVQAIRFSQEEWNSLFVHPDIFDSNLRVTSRVRGTDKVDTVMRSTVEVQRLTALRQTRDSLLGEVESLQTVVDTYVAQIQQLDDKIARFSGPNARKFTKIARQTQRNLQAKVDRIKVKLEPLMSDLAAQEKLVANQDLLVRSLQPGVRESALEKMRILVHGNGGTQPPALSLEQAKQFKQTHLKQAADNPEVVADLVNRGKLRGGVEEGILSRAEKSRSVVNSDATAVSERVANIGGSFARTPEGQLISRAEALQHDYYVSDWFDFLKRRDAVQETADLLRRKATEHDIAQWQVINLIEQELGYKTGKIDLEKIFNILSEKGYAPPESLKQLIDSGFNEDYAKAIVQLRKVADDIEKSVLTPPAGPVALQDAELVAQKTAQIGEQLPVAQAKAGGLQEQIAEVIRQQKAATDAVQFAKQNAKVIDATRRATTEQLKQLDEILQSVVREKINEWRRLRVGQPARTTRKGKAVAATLGEVEKLAKIADDAAEQAKTSFDAMAKLDDVMNGDIPIEVVMTNLDSTRKQLTNALGRLPKNWQNVTKGKNVTTARYETWMQLRSWLTTHNDLIQKFGKQAPDDPVYKALMDVFEAEGRFAIEQAQRGHAMSHLNNVSQEVILNRVLQPFEEGYVKQMEKLNKAARASGGDIYNQGKRSLEELGMPSLYGDSAFVGTLVNIGRIQQPVVAAELSRFMFRYTRFFKAYATATPGFHLRNAISNTFQMFAAGADVENMTSGLRIWSAFRDVLRSNEPAAIRTWVENLPQEQRGAALIAQQVYFALGGGRTEEALSGFVRKGSKLTDNFLLDWSRRTGQRVEGSARFILAYDSALKGMEFNEAFARTKRFLFDYSDPSIVDDAVRGIIPFWTWMSRNLPLQIVNQFSNPKAYVVYNHFANNMAGKPIPFMPDWMQQRGAIPLSDSNVLMPDIPHKSAEALMRDFANPSKLLSMVNPGIRAPFEFITNKKFYNDTSFSNRYYKLSGVNQALIPFMFASGQLEYNSSGQPVASDKAMYLATSLIPTLGQAQRLFPATEDGLSGQAFANWLGIPFRTVTPEMQKAQMNAEKRRKQSAQTKRKNIEGAR